jgi:hypothetical protein
MTTQDEDLFAGLSSVPPYLIAEDVLSRIAALPDVPEEILGLVHVAEARISMARRSRPRTPRGRGWLAKVTSFTFPRTFAQAWGDDGQQHLCFTVEVTDGGRAALGRQIEVQVPLSEAERLGKQMGSMATTLRAKTEVGEG